MTTEQRQAHQNRVPIARAVPPHGGVGMVSRDRLESLAQRLLDVPVALVTGAGGYGKTTLLLAWLEATTPRARTAWLSLVPDDISLSGLVEGVVLACSRAIPGFGGSVRALLSQREEDARVYATAIANELYLTTEELRENLVLFIDDAHALMSDSDAVKFTSGFLSSLPERVHVVIASRWTLSFPPLSKYRNAGRLLEVDEAALRFRPDEAVALVGNRGTAKSLVERTEGWAIALHLSSRLASDTKVHGDVITPSAGEAVFAFLAEEVVSLLEPDVRDLLGPLAVPATLDDAIVEQILERDDGAAVLERLAGQSLYIAQTDDGSWRLHQLFREFLLKRLRLENPERELEARRRYAALLRQRGDKLAALEQLIEAGDLTEIVEYVNEVVVTMRFTDRYRRLLELLSHVPAEVKARKPVLYRFHAVSLQRAGRWDEADDALQECYRAARANGDEGLALAALIERGVSIGSFRFRKHGDHEESLRCFQEALALAEGPSLRDRPKNRKFACEVLGLAHALRFEYEEAQRYLGQAERLELTSRTHTQLLFVEIARVYIWLGDFRRALEYAELAEALFRADAAFHVGYALIVQAKALLGLAEDPKRAIAICHEAIDAFRAYDEDEELGAAYETLAAALLAIEHPDLEAVLDACGRAEQLLDAHNSVARAEVCLLRARVFALTENAEAWESAMRRAQLLATGDRWLEARVLLEQSLREERVLGTGSEPASFERCAAEFDAMKDRYHAGVARLGLTRAVIGRDSAAAAEPAKLTIQHLATAGAACALHYDAGLGRAVLLWCVRNAIDLRATSKLYRRVASAPGDELAQIACDATLRPEARVAAVGLLAASDGAVARPLLREIARDSEPSVAAAAAARLAQLPPDSVVPLRIDVIADLRVSLGQEEIRDGDARWGRKKAAELLRLLAVSGGPLSRNAILQALWPDAYTGREVTLRVVLHSLRRALQPESDDPADYIDYDGSTIALRRSSVDSIDAELALSRLQTGKHRASIGDLAAAVELLEEAVAPLERAPKETSAPLWMHPHVQRWRAAALDGLRTLASIYRAERRQDASLTTIQRALALDILDETTVAAALEIFADAGMFDEARALYGTYKRRLADSLGAAPGPDVNERYARLLSTKKERKQSELSAREVEIVRLIAGGKTSKDIASALGLSVYTVNNHVGRILKKIGVESRAAAVAYVQGREGNLK
jgi:ATP/maltotriose-dependent transcriptional regulator MalT